MQFDDRRSFLQRAGTVLLGSTTLAVAGTGRSQETNVSTGQDRGAEVTPIEDLAREHGLLNRLLLIYDDVNRRLSNGKTFDPMLLFKSADIIRRFIEDYHEKLEEDYLFPRFDKAGKLTDEVAVLRQQHNAGRTLTSQIIQLSNSNLLNNATVRKKVQDLTMAFVRMYRPHEAREDTVIFPALRSIVSPNEYDSLGEDFESKEHQLFGSEGFDGILDQVVSIEKAMGLYDMRQYTPRSE
jgi:hemerythrin-like domain-containing protein